MKIIVVVGARPNFIKIAPLIWEFNRRGFNSYSIVHSGQHYDYKMSNVFFNELSLPEPKYYLNTGSGTHAEQTAKVMIEFEKVCLREKPELVIVVGDVNTTLACAITAKKLNLKVAHIESGLRSMDMTMPEEINRIVTDSICDLFFVSEKSGIENLKREGKSEDQLFFVGNIMIDTLFNCIKKLDDQQPEDSKLSNYAIVTLHRPTNVDFQGTLRGIIEALAVISEDMQIIFSVHPRTMKKFNEFTLMKIIEDSNINLINPLPYVEFIKLWKNANIVFTDSGGIQEETTALGVPCFTLRENTERPITVEVGTNTIVGVEKNAILKEYRKFKNGNYKKGRVPELWDGKTAQRIIDIIFT